MKENVAIVSHSYPTLQAPAQATFIKKEAHLLSDQFQIDIYLPSVYALPLQQQYYRTLHPVEPELTVHQFSYLSFPGKKLASITRKSLTKNLLKSLEKKKPDIVHLHWLYPAGLAAPALKKTGYPAVLTIHGGDWTNNVTNEKLMPVLYESLITVEKIICVGKKLSEEICAFAPKLKKKVIHIPHGIDSEQFHPASDKKKVAESLGWDVTKTNLLCVANMYHGKGIDLLIDAFEMQNDKENLHLHLVSPSFDEQTRADIFHRVENRSLEKLISIYEGMEQSQLSGFFRAADILISPSRREGFGLVVAEAISCGTPVLATRSGGPEEIVNSDSGMIVESDSSESLSIGLRSILDKLSSFDSETMHGYIKSNFSIRAKKEKLIAVYRDILK